MTARTRSGLLIAAGLLITLFAVLAFSRIQTTGEEAVGDTPATEAPPVTDTPPVTEAPSPAADDIAAEPLPATTVVHLATPPPEIDGLSETVSRVLAARGFAEDVGLDDPSGEIPASIVKVLAENGVTLSVAEEGTAP